MARSFKDNEGRTWLIDINTTTLKRIRALTGVDLMEIVSGKLIDRLYQDPVLLCDCVYAACKDEADTRNISDEDFGRALAGDAIDAATEALLDDTVSFCPNRRDRAIAGRVLTTTRKYMERARDVVEERIDSGAMEQAVERALTIATDSSGDAPELLASTPGP